MPHVQTVLGPVDPTELGRILPHEHLLALTPGPWLSGGATNPDRHDDDQVATAVGALARLPELGFDTVVDLSPYGVVGRDPHGDNVVLLRRIAEATTGIGGTDIKAGVLGEQATGLDQMTPHEEKCLRAAARAQRATGLALCTHTTHGAMAFDQIDILVRQEGCDPAQIVIGHMDTHPDTAYIRAVLETGVYVAFDTIGKQHWDFRVCPIDANQPDGDYHKDAYKRSDHTRADRIATLVAAGFTQQILLSHDITGSEVYLNPDTHGHWGFSNLPTRFADLLTERGITLDLLDIMTRANPLQVLTVG